jgi:hypothetical protein
MRLMRTVLAISTNRSAKQFARGHRSGIFTVSIPGAGQHAVERGGEMGGSVADEEPESGGTVAEVHQQLAGLLHGQAPAG